MTTFIRSAFFVLALSPAFAFAQTWTIDSSHSAATFKVRHLMVSDVRGEFQKITGTVAYDGKDLSKAVIDISIDAKSINTREPKRDEHLRSADFFDVEKHPVLTFKSKKITPKGKGKFEIKGDLTIRGTTKEVTLAATGPTPEVKDPWGNIKIGASAATKINRKDFGLTWNKALEAGGVLVGDEVEINLDIELTKPAAASTK